MTEPNRIRTGLWKRDKGIGASKPVYIEAGHYWINVYKNDYKQTDTQPDYNLELKEAEPRGESAPAPSRQQQPRQSPPQQQTRAPKPAPMTETDFGDDDIPF